MEPGLDDEEDDDNGKDNDDEDETSIMSAAPKRRAKAKVTNDVAPSAKKATSTPAKTLVKIESFYVGLHDPAQVYYYISCGKKTAAAEFHVRGVINEDAYEVNMSDCGKFLLWKRALPKSFFELPLELQTERGRCQYENETCILAKSNVVHEIRSAFKYDGRKGEIFCDETQSIPLEFQCAKPIVTVIARLANGEVVVDSTNESHDQYDTILSASWRLSSSAENHASYPGKLCTTTAHRIVLASSMPLTKQLQQGL